MALAQSQQQVQQMQQQMQELIGRLQQSEQAVNDKTQETQARAANDARRLDLEERKVAVSERDMDLKEAIAEHNADVDLVDQENEAVKTAYEITNAEYPNEEAYGPPDDRDIDI